MNQIIGTFNNQPIASGRHGNLPCYEDILQVIQDRMNVMVSNHNKVFFLRFDVGLPEGTNLSNPEETFRNCWANFIKATQRNYGKVHYVWCKEMSPTNNNLHWHCLVLFDGNKTQNIHGHISKFKELWARALGIPSAHGLVDNCNRPNPYQLENGIKIIRSAPDFNGKYSYCFHWASYLAKVATKENINGRRYGSSQI